MLPDKAVSSGMRAPLRPLRLAVQPWIPRRTRLWFVRRVAPTFTVGVMCVVLDPAGQVLLVQQPYRDLLFLPGGVLRRGEEVEQAASRELLEETGLQVEFTPTHLGQHLARLRWVTWVASARVDAAQASAAVARPPEVTRIEWQPLGRLDGVAPGVREAVQLVATSRR